MNLFIEGISFSYMGISGDRNRLLEDVSLTLEMGKPLILTGDNGSGKSTLLRLISGDLAADSGFISISERSNKKNKIFEFKDVFHLKQNPSNSLFPDLTLEENVAIFARKLKILHFDPYQKSKNFRFLEDKIANVFPFYTDAQNIKVSDLSGGEIQLFAISLAISLNFRILLFDEPTSALDKNRKSELISIFKKNLTDGNFISIIASHDWPFIKSLQFEIFNLDHCKTG